MDRLADGWTWTGSSCGATTSSARTSSPTRPRSASSTTPSTTTARSTSCSKFDLERVPVRAGRASASNGVLPRRGLLDLVEVCGVAPSRRSAAGRGPQGAFWESANVRVDPTGSAIVDWGASPHGQGLDDELRPDRRRPLGIDRRTSGPARRHRPGRHGLGHVRLALAGRGRGGGGARGAQGAGEGQAHLRALLEAAPEDIELADGKIQARGLARQGDDDGEISGAVANTAERSRLLDGEPGLEEEASFDDLKNFVFSFRRARGRGVEVDAETG